MTMIGLPNNGFDTQEDYLKAVEEVAKDMDPGKTFTVLGPNHDVIEVDGKQYAQLPEGWPAEEEPSLLEAHVEHVMTEGEGLSAYEEELYSFTPAEVKELAEGYIDAMNELRALRKGMKTMQRKTRKQAQIQRRLERRLSQARAGREQLRDTASRLAQHGLDEAARALLEVLDKRGLVVREGE